MHYYDRCSKGILQQYKQAATLSTSCPFYQQGGRGAIHGTTIYIYIFIISVYVFFAKFFSILIKQSPTFPF